MAVKMEREREREREREVICNHISNPKQRLFNSQKKEAPTYINITAELCSIKK